MLIRKEFVISLYQIFQKRKLISQPFEIILYKDIPVKFLKILS